MISLSYSFHFFSLYHFVYFFRSGPQGDGEEEREREIVGERNRAGRVRFACVCGLKAKLCQAQLECIASIKCGAHM